MSGWTLSGKWRCRTPGYSDPGSPEGPAPSLWETRPSAVDHCEVWEITLLLPTPPVLLQVCSSWLQGCLAFSVACMEDKSGRIVLDHIVRYDVDRC